ncbi:MAG: DeoR family transcriptional regulator [Pseudomonadota bacterium]
MLYPERRSLAHQRVRSLNNVMRYFAALDNDQITEVLGVTDRTVRRDLEKARLLLLDALL